MTWLLRNFILALSGNDSPYQLAFGAMLGWALGFCSIKTPIFAFLIVIVLFFRVNISLVGAAFLCAKMLTFFLMEVIVQLGTATLTLDALNGFWTLLYNTPYIAISGFNQPKVMGALVLGLIFGIIGFPFIMKFTPYYREKILPILAKFWIIRLLKGSKLMTILIK